jgi:hypothetical protein
MADGNGATPGDEPPAEEPSKKYDQAFFFALAAKGKDAWNAWRHDPANKDVHVTFAGIDFSEAPRDAIDFSGFEFGDNANFSDCKWRGVEWEEFKKNPEGFSPGRACFTGAAFGDVARFDGAAFGDWPRFDGAAFGDMAIFHGATFGDAATFGGSAFGDWAIFGNAAFGHNARFDGAAFGADASFDDTTFGDAAIFSGAAFGDRAKFRGAAFGDFADFAGAAFGDEARFANVAFGDEASFADTRFKGRVQFTGKLIEQHRRDFDLNLNEADEKVREARIALKKRHEDSWTRFGSGPDRFLAVSFGRTRFDGEAVFSRRTFEGDVDFTNARFYRPPDFDAAASAARIDFSGVHIGFVLPSRLLHWTSESKVPVRLRRLRKLAEDTKNHDLERDLYIEERKAERGVYLHQLLGLDELKENLEDINKQKKHVWLEWRLQRRARNAHWLGILTKPDKIVRLIAHLLWIAVMGIYWGLSNYGRNFVLPAAWLIASGFFFYWRYTEVLAQLMAKAPDIEKYKQAVRMLALGNTVPFVGPLTIDSKVKEFLFCPCRNCSGPLIPPEGYQLLVVAQNLVSIILVFFIGLALRNYFKIK